MFHRLMNYSEIDPKPNVVLTRELIKKHMPKYKRLDDMIVIEEAPWEEFKCSLPLPVYKDKNSPHSVDEDELAFLVCQSVDRSICRRLVIDKNTKNDNHRIPNIEIILGDDGLVCRKENQITFEFDVTKCVYSFGNLNEKIRMGKLKCSNEFVVDLFAGIGHYTLPLIMHASAAHVYSCEQDEEALKALKKNLQSNKVDPHRYTIIEGDIRINRPAGVAHRIILGILPTSYVWLTTAFECIDKNLGAILHCHELIECKLAQTSSSGDVSMATVSSGAAGDLSMSTSTVENEEVDQETKVNDAGVSKKVDEGENIELQSTNTKQLDIKNPNDYDETKCLSPISNDEQQSIDSPPVLLEYPTEEQQSNISFINESSSTSTSNSVALTKEELSVDESLDVSEQEMNTYIIRASQFVDCLQGLVNERNPNLFVKLMDIHVVKTFANSKNHVVFDIQVKPLIQFNGLSAN